ncbi:MAG: hypothetical protein ACLUNV_06940 [Sutterella wadsworthensis]
MTDSFTAGKFTVENNGTLVLTSKAAGLKIAEGTAAENIAVTNNGTITFTDAAGEFATLDAVQTVKGKLASSGNGLIVFGDKVTVKADAINRCSQGRQGHGHQCCKASPALNSHSSRTLQ